MSEPCTSSEPHSPAKQLRLYQCRSNTVSQKTVDRLKLNFITEGLQPFSIVSLPAFKELVTNLCPGKTVMCRETVKSRLKNHVTEMKRHLRIVLESVETVATTTDCWSARGKSYIGVTAHWINKDNMERISAALACQRLTGSHTYDVLARTLENIHNEYGIGNKVCKTTTDKGSNFVKAFSVFGINNVANTDEMDVNNEDDEESEDDISDDVIYHNITNNLDGNIDDEDYDLPSHQRCACHTLQLIATGDADKAEENTAYKKLSRVTFSKCQALWNKSSRSVLAAEAVQSNCGMALIKPNKTRWNSVYMAIERLVRIIKQKGEESLHLLCNELKIPR